MTESVADLYVVLNSITDPFSKGMKAAAADAESQSKRMSSALGAVTKIGLGLGAATLGIGAASIKAATSFQSEMTKLVTQAGVAQNQMAGLTNGVLNLAGQVGFSPTSLAESLYHVESNFESMGIKSADALNLVKIAAEGAQVGGADLVDVTNALTAAVASGIPGVQNMSDAMGALNAIVGVGDMNMQQLADAFGTGMLATVKGFGVTLDDVGAGLATFGDNNIRGAAAGTDFRMAIQALAHPVATAGATLTKLGLTTDTLAQDMQRGGMKLALTDLIDRMNKAGITADQQGQVITDAFGRKAGTGINILVGQFDRVTSKYPKLDEGIAGFSHAWDVTKNTFGQQIKDIEAGVDSLGVRIGLWLIPQVSNLITTLQGAGSQVVAGFTGAALKPVQHAPMHSAFMNQEMSAPSLTGWQEFGAKIHQYLTDIEQDAVKLEPLGEDVVRFGEDMYQGGVKLLSGLEPTAKLLGTGLVAGLETTGKVLANVVGPAFKDFADFIDGHQRLIEYFAVTVLGGLATKMAVLGAINATKGLINLATAVMQFPLQQTGQIKTAFDEMKVAWTGQEAAQGEAAIQGLSGAFTNLKGAASGVLDKMLPSSGNLAGLAQVSKDFDGIELSAQGADEQLSLFATTQKGIVQVSETQQLSLFDEDLGNIETTAGNATVALGETASASEGLAGTLGKFALAGGVIGAAIVGVQMFDQAIGHLTGVGSHAAETVEQYGSQLQLAANGSLSAADDFAKSAVQMALTSHLSGQSVTGMKNIDQAMAQMVSGGNAQAAESEFARIAQALQNQGFNAQQTADQFPQYERALKDAGDAAQTMDSKIQDSLNSMQRQQGLSQFNKDLGNLQQQLKASGNALAGTSAAAGTNQQAFQNLAQEMGTFYQSERNSGQGAYQATADYQNQYIALENLAIATLGSKDAADKFLGTLNLIKPSYDTAINLDVGKAYQQLNGLIQSIDSSTGTVQITGTGGGAYAGGKALAWWSNGGMAEGGFVPGQKNAPVPMLVHGGEYVVSNDMQAGRQAIDPRVLSGIGLGSRSAGHAPGGAAGVTVVNNYIVNVAGSVLSQMELENVVRTQVLRTKNRNSSNLLG